MTELKFNLGLPQVDFKSTPLDGHTDRQQSEGFDLRSSSSEIWFTPHPLLNLYYSHLRLASLARDLGLAIINIEMINN